LTITTVSSNDVYSWWCVGIIGIICGRTWVVNMATVEAVREKSLLDYRKKLLEHKEVESRLKESMYSIELLFFCNKHYLNMHTNLDII
jgi:hypothetical protein